jgi:hypothetical protein
MKSIAEETHWSLWRKILFRFFFIFFSLEILNQHFLGNWFPGGYVWELGARIFTPPCLWLNDHFFHLYYKAESWTTFSASLVLIRMIVYLLLAFTGCLVWTLLQRKKANYNRLDFWFREVLCFCSACTMLFYGVIKIFPVQMRMPTFINLNGPVGDLTPFDLLWLMMGYGQPYQTFTGIGEAVGATLILFRRSRPIGLAILIGILSNIVLLNYTYVIGVQELSIVLLLISFYLFEPYLKNLWQFFFSNEPVSQLSGQFHYRIKSNWKYLVYGIPITILLTSVVVNVNRVYKRQTLNRTINESRQYSEVKNFVVNSDTLKNLIEGDTIRWRFWSEWKSENRLQLSLNVMNTSATKTYFLTRDSVQQTITLKPSKETDTTSLQFKYKEVDKLNWHLEGIVNGSFIVADLQKIDPAKRLNLLRTKREFFMIDSPEN